MSIHYCDYSWVHLIVIQMGLGLVSVSKLGRYRWVHPLTSDLFKYLTNTIKETSEKDGHGWSAWRDFRSWWSCSVSDILSLTFYLDVIGCDALNATVSDDVTLIHPLSYPYQLQQLEVLLGSNALGLGCSWWTVVSQIAVLANFYLTTWEEYHTGMLPHPPHTPYITDHLFLIIVCIRPVVSRILFGASRRNYYDYHDLHYHWLSRFATCSFLS